MKANYDPRQATTVTELLRRRADRHADRPAFTFLDDGTVESARLSYGELDLRARALAARLQARGVAGERVLLLLPPGLDFVVAFFACLYAGAVAVPSYPPGRRRGDGRIRSIVHDCRPRLVLTQGALDGRSEGLEEDLAGVERCRLDELAGGDGPGTGSESGDLGRLENDAACWRDPGLASGSLAFLQYTSGSTAEPKGVMVTHGHLLHNEEMIRRAFAQGPDSLVVGWLPLYHDMGLIGNVLQPLYVGGSCVLMSPMAFLQRPFAWLSAVSRYRATTSGGPNFAYDLCVDKIGDAEKAELDLSSWRVAFNGAEPVRAATQESFARAFAPCGFDAKAFYPCYGLAEATLFVTGGDVGSAPPTRCFAKAALDGNRALPLPTAEAAAGQVLVGNGRPWLEQTVIVVDPESRVPVADGSVGEIWIAGSSVAAGYWERPEQSEETFRARLAGGDERTFLRTGDLGFRLDGELFVTGRLKDLIIVRGRNLYPQDIERTAATHADLQPGGGAAFTVEHGGSERLIVVHEVRRRPAADLRTIRAAVQQLVAEVHEVAAEVVLIKTGTALKTTSGKIRRRACRQAYLDGRLELAAARPATRTRAAASAPAAASPAPTVEPLPDRASLLALAAPARVAALREALAVLAARILRLETSAFDGDHPLTAQGLDSLTALELKHACSVTFGAEPTFTELLDGASVGALAELLAGRLHDGEATSSPGRDTGPGPAASATAAVDPALAPATPGQVALWLLEARAPEAIHNLAGAVRVEGRIDVVALQAAVDQVVLRHAALRTTFEVAGGELMQRVHASLPADVGIVDARDLDAERLGGRCRADAYARFDLATGPLLRLRLYRRGAEDDVLLLVIHHLVCDLWSFDLLVADLESAYRDAAYRDAAYREAAAGTMESLQHGAAASAAASATSFTAFASAEQERLRREGDQLWTFWSRQLAGDLPVLSLPTDRPRPAEQRHRGVVRHRRVPAGVLAQVRALAAAEKTTLYTVLLAAFQTLLHRHSGQLDLVIGTPAAGRDAAALAGTVGYFVNPLPLRVRFDGDPSFRRLLAQVRQTSLAAFAHQGLPFVHMVERLGLRPDASRSPVFQAFFVFEQPRRHGSLAAFPLDVDGARLDFADLTLVSQRLDRQVAQFELLLFAAVEAGELVLALELDADLYDPSTGDRWLEHLENLLVSATTQADTAISRLALSSHQERAWLLDPWPTPRLTESVTTGVDAMPAPTLHGIFEVQATRRPDAVAVVCGLEELSYGDLERRANQLAHVLRRRGVGGESLVGLCLDRSLDMVVAILGILKAGAAYLPLDPTLPAERLAVIVEDARDQLGLRLLIGTSGQVEGPLSQVDAGVRLLLLDQGAAELDAAPGDRSSLPVDPDQLAYVIYTSGSTGRPKGVLVPHRNVVRLFSATSAWFQPGEQDVWSLFHSYGFDFSVWELWGALLYGGRLVVVPHDVCRSPAAFYELLVHEGVTVLSQTPAAFYELIRAEEARGEVGCRALRAVVFGGEALDLPALRPWLERRQGEPGQSAGNPALINMYGITETTVHVTYRPLRRADVLRDGASRVGEPIPDQRLYVVSAQGELQPVGVAGELWVGGAGLARGYGGRPALTADRFRPDPFSGVPGARVYRSGDLGRLLPNGDVEYLGRIDQQVKIRGFRIELEDVQANLLADPSIEQAVVVVRSDDPSQPRLVAYVVPRPAAHEASPAHWRRHLAARLPDYMVPAHFVALDRLPMTGNGKVDRRALPPPEAAPAAISEAPRSATAIRLAAIWGELLGTAALSTGDDFFEVGGHSLLATRLASRVRDGFGLELPLAVIFQRRTLAALAAWIDAAGGDVRRDPEASPPATIEAVPRTGLLRLSTAQERLWLAAQLSPSPGLFNVPVALRIDGPLDVAAVEHSLRGVIARHESLRTTFERQGSWPVQQISARVRLPFVALDLRTLPAEERWDTVHRLAVDESEDGFDLVRGPLLRARLLCVEDTVHVLLLTLHHLVADHWSLGILVREWAHHYAGGASLEPLPIHYADYAAHERRRVDGAAGEQLLAFWRRQLAGAPQRLDLPFDRPRPAVRRGRGGVVHTRTSPDLRAAMEPLLAGEGVTLYMLLLAAYFACLHRASGADDLLVGTDVSTRDHLETEGLVGLFVNQLVLRADLAGRPSFRQLLGRVRENVQAAFEHRALPFDRLVEALGVQRQPDVTPIFQVLFDLHNAPLPELRLGDARLSVLETQRTNAKYDLSLFAEESAEGLRFTLEYDADLWDAESAERWLASYHQVLLQAVADPDRSLSQLAAARLPEGETGRHQAFVAAFNDDLG